MRFKKPKPASNKKPRTKISLAIIPEPELNTRTVLVGTLQTPMFNGGEDVDLLCGGCGFVLAKGVSQTTLGNVVLRCFSCRAFNDNGTTTDHDGSIQ